MKSIQWHNKDDKDFFDILDAHRNCAILAQTNLGYTTSNTRYFEPSTGKLISVGEILIGFALIDSE